MRTGYRAYFACRLYRISLVNSYLPHFGKVRSFYSKGINMNTHREMSEFVNEKVLDGVLPFHLRFFLICIFVAILVLSLSIRAGAAITATGDVSPADPATWVSNTFAYIGNTSTGTVLVDGGSGLVSGNAYLSYTSGDGTVTITGSGSKWTNSGTLVVGASGTGTLTIGAGGQLINYSGYVGNNFGSSGSATVTGAGSKWTNSSSLYIGNYGNGTLTVADGAVVTAKTLYASLSDLGGNGTVSTNGAVFDADLTFDKSNGLQQTFQFGAGGSLNLNLDGSADLGAGYKGIGTLTVADGMAVTSYNGYLGYLTGSVGTATVTGTGSKWTSTDLNLGKNGSGSLSAINGGAISVNNLFVGYSGTGTLTVSNGGSANTGVLYGSLNDLHGNGTISTDGAVLDANIVFDSTHGPQTPIAIGEGGSLTFKLTGSADFGAGYKGVGTLRIADGIAIASSSGYLGYMPSSSGTATITGANSKWNMSITLNVGTSGNGVLIVEAGGQVSDQYGYLGQSPSVGTAKIAGNGSIWTNSNSLTISNGILDVEAGGQVSNFSGYLGYNKNSTGTATITGTGSKWMNSVLYLGYSGSGDLIVSDNGSVTVTNNLYVGMSGNGTLTVNNGGSVSTGSLWGSLNDMSGDGTVNAKGVVLDANLVFDATHGVQQPVPFGTGGKLVLNFDGSGTLGAGYRGAGSVRIADGIAITSSSGTLGNRPGSVGTATVAGVGSKWTDKNNLYIGDSGNGNLSVVDGGRVLDWLRVSTSDTTAAAQ